MANYPRQACRRIAMNIPRRQTHYDAMVVEKSTPRWKSLPCPIESVGIDAGTPQRASFKLRVRRVAPPRELDAQEPGGGGHQN